MENDDVRIKIRQYIVQFFIEIQRYRLRTNFVLAVTASHLNTVNIIYEIAWFMIEAKDLLLGTPT